MRSLSVRYCLIPARQHGRYGYRRIAAMLREAGWQLNDKRVERLWRREGLKVPMKQPRRNRGKQPARHPDRSGKTPTA